MSNKKQTIKKEWLPRIYEVYSTRSDLSTLEKAELLNKEFETNFGESTFRKKAKTYGDGLNAGLEDSAVEKDLERIALAKLRVKQERKILNIQSYKITKELNDSIAYKEISNILVDKFKQIKPQELGKIKNNENNEKYTEMFFVGDEQYRGYEEEKKQLKMTFKQIDKYATTKHIILNLMGDMIEGMHRSSTLLSIKKDTTSQVIDYMSALIEGITSLYQKGYKLEVNLVSSNHTNLRPQGKNEFPQNDMAYIIGWTMKQLSKNLKGVEVRYNDMVEFVQYGKRFVLLHGHQGFGGNKKSLEISLVKLLGYLPDFIVMGHYHQYKITKEGKHTLIVVPSIKISTENYERSAGYTHEPAILKVKFFKGTQDFESRIIHFGKKMEIQGGQ